MENLQISIYDEILEQIKQIDLETLVETEEELPITKIIEKQKIYFWIRLYLKDEISNLELGDLVEINYSLTEESTITQFIGYDKKGSITNDKQEVVSFDKEEDRKVLILMIDEEIINSDEIPFIRTLFKTSSHYEDQVYRRDDLTFTNLRTNQKIEYYDSNF
jgi:hypothetical protein